MRGDITLQILGALQTGEKIIGDILDTAAYYGHHQTYKRMKGIGSQLPERRPILKNALERARNRQKISKLLYKLQKDGLIKKESTGEKKFWQITGKGGQKLATMRLHAKPQYSTEQSNEIKLIIFDIPETERRNRNWLRETLKYLRFTMLQKSVWIGKTILPEEFLADLHQRRLVPYVEIFAITKTGSIKQIQ